MGTGSVFTLMPCLEERPRGWCFLGTLKYSKYPPRIRDWFHTVTEGCQQSYLRMSLPREEVHGHLWSNDCGKGDHLGGSPLKPQSSLNSWILVSRGRTFRHHPPPTPCAMGPESKRYRCPGPCRMVMSGSFQNPTTKASSSPALALELNSWKNLGSHRICRIAIPGINRHME